MIGSATETATATGSPAGSATETACTAEPILFPARLAGNEKRRIFIVPFMKNGYPKPQET